MPGVLVGDDLGVKPRSLGRDPLLELGDHRNKLLVGKLADDIGMLKFVLARHEQGENLHGRGRLRPAHTLNRLRTAMTKVSQQRRDELAIQLLAVTRADRTAGRVA